MELLLKFSALHPNLKLAIAYAVGALVATLLLLVRGHPCKELWNLTLTVERETGLTTFSALALPISSSVVPMKAKDFGGRA